MLEIEEENRDFVTIYNKDYKAKKISKVNKFIQTPNYEWPSNAINGAYREYLNTRRKNATLPKEERTEDISENFQRMQREFPHLIKYLPQQAPNEDIIEREQKKSLITIYQLDYSPQWVDHGQQTASHTRLSLPANWLIPETIYGSSYRNLESLLTRQSNPKHQLKKPKNNLVPDLKARKILRIKTGVTEYQSVIGMTGTRILKEPAEKSPRELD